ncbi:MAG: PocR ligand-binding domain-containing protein [Clostridia bacterium]|nr:PocR ligand-binding domain-containing protein [Clostridia bacterium]
MYINFKIEKLDELLLDFYRLTGLTISVWDNNMNQLSFQPKQMCKFCKKIKSNKRGKERCYISDKELFSKCAKTGKVETHRCHAGLIDTAIPIRFNDAVLGYLIFGQAVDGNETDIENKIKKLGLDLGMDHNELKDLYNELKPYDAQKIQSAGNILKTAARYLWLSDYIEIGYNTLASQIDDYIKSNLTEKLSLQKICTDLGLSKNKLYEISNKQFNMPIGSYISHLRVLEAKNLLTSTSLSVREISEQVGFDDYNYFIKLFKNNVGTTPLKYRNGFPFNIHD